MVAQECTPTSCLHAADWCFSQHQQDNCCPCNAEHSGVRSVCRYHNYCSHSQVTMSVLGQISSVTAYVLKSCLSCIHTSFQVNIYTRREHAPQHIMSYPSCLSCISKRKLKSLYRPFWREHAPQVTTPTFWREHAPQVTTLIVEAASQIAVLT